MSEGNAGMPVPVPCKTTTTKKAPIDGRLRNVRWHTPAYPVRGKTDLFISKKTHLQAYMKQCRKLLDSGEEAVYLHGSGSAINRTIALALRLKREALGSLDVDVTTTALICTGEMAPVDDETDYEEVSKNVSAVHVKVFKPLVPVKNY